MSATSRRTRRQDNRPSPKADIRFQRNIGRDGPGTDSCNAQSRTFIGRIERGFDFLGYHFSPAGLIVAKQTVVNFVEKAFRLYEQKRNAVLAATALEMYAR